MARIVLGIWQRHGINGSGMVGLWYICGGRKCLKYLTGIVENAEWKISESARLDRNAKKCGNQKKSWRGILKMGKLCKQME